MVDICHRVQNKPIETNKILSGGHLYRNVTKTAWQRPAWIHPSSLRSRSENFYCGISRHDFLWLEDEDVGQPSAVSHCQRHHSSVCIHNTFTAVCFSAMSKVTCADISRTTHKNCTSKNVLQVLVTLWHSYFPWKINPAHIKLSIYL